MNLLQQIKNLTKREEVREVALLSGVKIVSAGLSFLGIVIIARTLGTYNFGIFSLAMGVTFVAIELAGAGMDIGMVRFSSHYLEKDEKLASLVFKIAFKIKVLASFTVFVIGYLIAEPVAKTLFHQPQATTPLRLAFLVTFAVSMWRYVLAILQSYQFFNKYAVLDLMNNLLKVLGVALVCFLFTGKVTPILAVYAVIPFLSFSVGLIVVRRDFLTGSGDHMKARKELIRFSKWIIISGLLCIVYNRLDIFMLGYFKETAEVGTYSVAFNLTSGMDILIISIITVFLPKVSKIVGKKQYISYIRRSTTISGMIILILLPFFFLAKPVILNIFGNEFIDSVVIFRILFLGFMVSILVIPSGLLFYSLNLPHYLTVADAGILTFNFLGNYVFIPKYGAVGAAYVTMCTKLLIGLIAVAIVYLKIFK